MSFPTGCDAITRAGLAEPARAGGNAAAVDLEGKLKSHAVLEGEELGATPGGAVE